MVVIDGHELSTNSIEVMDPGVGSKLAYAYNYFKSNSQFTWKESIY